MLVAECMPEVAFAGCLVLLIVVRSMACSLTLRQASQTRGVAAAAKQAAATVGVGLCLGTGRAGVAAC